MSISKATLTATAERLRKQVSTAEASLETLRHKLAAAEAKILNAPAPLSGLDQLWKTALPMARLRSSKFQCRSQWNRIPPAERPPLEVAISALKAWNRSSEWKKDGNLFVPGLHRFIQNRMWEDLPEGSTRDGLARYRTTPKPIPQHLPEDEITDPAEIARFLSLRPLRVNS